MSDQHITAFDALASLIRSDPDYAWSWHCNIAMPIMDAYAPTFGAATVMGWVPNDKQHQIANEAAAHLMQHLFDCDITTNPLYEHGKSNAQQYAEFRIAMDEAEDAKMTATSGGAA